MSQKLEMTISNYFFKTRKKNSQEVGKEDGRGKWGGRGAGGEGEYACRSLRN